MARTEARRSSMASASPAASWSPPSSLTLRHHDDPRQRRPGVRQAETNGGLRPGLTTDERERLKVLERENFELRRANEILKSASAFFAAELDRRPRR